MFACLCLVSSQAEHVAPLETWEALLELAGDFSPRFEMVRPYLVVVEIGGLRRLLGTPQEIGDAFCRVARERGLVVSVAIAATHTTARLLAMHGAPAAFADPLDAGILTVVPPGHEAAALAPLPLALLTQVPYERVSNDDVAYLRRRNDRERIDRERDRSRDRDRDRADDRDGAMRASGPDGIDPASAAAPPAWASTSHASPQGQTRGKRGRGWSFNYRLAPAPLTEIDSSSASNARTRARGTDESSEAVAATAAPTTATATTAAATATATDPPPPSPADETRAAILDVLRRWGLKTLGEFVRLPAADLFARLGREGVALQQIARGQDARPLVPTIAGEPFEATLALDWPIDTLEPLSFVLTRLLDPLCARLERCDRGAAVLQVTLQLVTRRHHVRRLELPAPMRDPKVLRTLVLLDLESHPPDAGIDRITIAIDPTPGRIVQHSLLVRALPSPEQLSTLMARLTAVMGDGRVGAPALLDSHRPDAFEMRRFEVPEPIVSSRKPPRPRPHASARERRALPERVASSESEAGRVRRRYVLRRFRRAIPARVTLAQDRPVHVAPEGLPAGLVIQAAGPWRTSGEWWNALPRLHPTPAAPSKPPRTNRPHDAWDRDEWDVALDNGSFYRLHLDHRQSRWYLEASLD